MALLLKNDDRAVVALEKALKANQTSPFLSKGLARLYEVRGEISKARQVLENCLEGLPGDKATNAALGRIITTYFPSEGARAEYYWRRGFTEGDANYASQFWYARQLYLNGKTFESRDAFRKLRGARVAPDVKSEIVGSIMSPDGKPVRFQGNVQRLEATYAWLSKEGEVGWVFLHRSNVDSDRWDSLSLNQAVTYGMGFNYSGPAGYAIEII